MAQISAEKHATSLVHAILRGVRAVALSSCAVTLVALPACSGGGGDLPDYGLGTEPYAGRREAPSGAWDRPTGGADRPTGGLDRAPVSTEPPPGGGAGAGGGGGGGTAFACDGKYTCNGEDDDDDTVTLSRGDDGTCRGPSGIVLTADGKLTINGQTVGSWTASGAGFSITYNGRAQTCTKV